jgi:hypothetical protein
VSRRVYAAAIVAVIAIDAVARSARAQERKTSSLGWTRLEGAESCIGTRELALAVEQQLGRAVFVSAAQGEVALEGRIERLAPRGWRAVITLSSAGGEILGTRELTSDKESCRALDEPLSLTLALMIDPEAALRPRAPPTPAPASPPVAPAPPAPAPPPQVIVRRETVLVPVDRPAPPPEDAWRADGFAAMAVGFGMVPGVGLGGRVGALVEPPWFAAVEGTATVWKSANEDVDARSGASVSFLLVQAGLSVCPLWKRGTSLAASLCGGAELGLYSVTADGFDRSTDETRPLAALTARARGTYRFLGPVFATVGVTLAVPLIRDRFYYRAADASEPEVFRVAPVTVAPEIGLGLTIP